MRQVLVRVRLDLPTPAGQIRKAVNTIIVKELRPDLGVLKRTEVEAVPNS
jgi:hypothetical protein